MTSRLPSAHSLVVFLCAGCGAAGDLGRSTNDASDRRDALARNDGAATDALPRSDAGARSEAGHGSSDGAATRSDSTSGGDAGTGCDSGASDVACLAVAETTQVIWTIAVDDMNVYWAATGPVNAQNVVMRVSRGGGDAVTLAHASPSALVSDGTSVYWPDYVEGAIVSVAVGGGALTTLASASPACIAVDQDSVYWSASAAVMKVAKTGGTPVTLAAVSSGGYAIAVHGSNVYWLGEALMQLSTQGGTPTTLLGMATQHNEPPDVCRAIAVSNGEIFVVGETPSFATEILSLPATGTITPTVVVPATDSPVQVVANTLDIFWQGFSTEIDINEASVDGGPTTTLAMPLAQRVNDVALASDGTVYWTTDNQIQSIKP